MTASVLTPNTHNNDCPFMPLPSPALPPVSSFSQSQSPRKKQTHTVHFSEDTVPGEGDKNNQNMAGANGSNRSASRSSATRGPAKTVAVVVPDSINGHELTSVDKKWGVLLDGEGQPTRRFVDVMSSLARYMIDAFPVAEGDGLVLVPAMMAAFYSVHTVDDNPFRYQFIFHHKSSHRSLAELYQDLGCSYHLVQTSPASPPRIPGLTREGFARWMALQLQAFPDAVAARLEQCVSGFPLEMVSAVDGKSERLPKQLSRYLLPARPDYRIRALLQQAVRRHFGDAALPAAPVPPRPALRPATQPALSISYSDGERDAPRRRRPEVVIAGHRRYSSYSGPVAHNDDGGRGRRGHARRSESVERGHDERHRSIAHSLIDALLHPGRSTDKRHRIPSPPPRRHGHGHNSHRTSLPAIHNASADYDDIPTSKTTVDGRHRPISYKATERRDRDDRSYRMYGSSLPQSPLPTSPVLEYAPALQSEARRGSSCAAAKPARREHQTTASLRVEDGFSSDDQTWDEYLRVSD